MLLKNLPTGHVGNVHHLPQNPLFQIQILKELICVMN